MKSKLTKLFTLLAVLTLFVGQAWAQLTPALPASTLTLPTIPTEGWKGNVTPTYYKAEGSNVYVFSPYELYSSVANLTWTTQNSGGNGSGSPSAMVPFPASTVFTGFKAATLNGTSKGPYAYRVANCVAAYVYCKSGSNKKRTITLAAYEVDGEGNVAASAAASETYELNEDGVISIDLNASKEYYIKVSQVGSGSGGSSSGNSTFYMLGLQAPYKVTLEPNGGAYDPTPTGWTLSDGKYYKYVAAGSLSIPTGIIKGGNVFNCWKNKNSETVASPLTIDKDTVLTAQWTPTGGTTHDITYTNTKGADNSANPTEFYEGVGVASFEPLTDVANFHFTGWSPASIADDATTDQTIDAQWVASYNVTFSAGEGTGAVPDAFQKWEGATFNLPEKGSLTHATKVFDGWKANGTGDKIAAGAEYTMTAAAVEFVAQWKAAPQVIYYWQSSYSSSPTQDSPVDVTGGTIEWKSDDSGKSWGNESYNKGSNVVPEDLQVASGKKAVKSGGNAVYAVLTLSGSEKFKAGDTIYVGGYNSWMFSTSKQRYNGDTPTDDPTKPMSGDIANIATGGTSNSTYNYNYAVIPEGIDVSTMYVIRGIGSGSSIAAIKVIRPVKYTVNFAAGEGTGTMAAKEYPATAEVTLPECTFTAPASKEFDAWTSSDVTISAGKFTMPANDVTITATWKAETPKYDITYYPGTGGSGSIDPAKKTKDVDFVLSSERFTRAGYLQTGWATADGGAKVYELGATYTENADLDLYPFWTELDTYVASFACDDAAPAGWTFSNDGWADNVATAAYVCKFVENGISTPLQAAAAGKDGTTENDVAFAKNADAIATYDLGITTTVAALNVVLNGGSSSAFNETIEYLGADGTTVKQSYVTSLNAGNWNDNTISKTDVVADVRYIRVHGASKWVVMKSFSVSYIETRTKYDVAFAAGTGASGTMPTLHYAEGAEVVLPAATFTPPTDKEFDAWTSSDVTITDGKFTMPASDVTVTATWKDAITRYDVTFETNGGSTIDAQEVEENGHPTAVADPTKANYVFVGWFNNSDLAPEHAVADITALTITDDITLYAKWQLDIRLRQLVFSNGFDAFIKNNEVKAYYMEGTSAPTMVSYQGVNLKDVADAVTIVGNKVRMVGTDDSVIELDLILEAVTPMSSYDKQIFDGTETYVKTGNEFSTTSGKLGWKFSKNDGDWSRETPGQNRIYFFVGGSADRATFTSGASSRAIKVYVNNELVSSVETTAAAGSTFDIPLPAANAYNMIAIISNQTSGDGSVTDIQLNEHVISTDVSLSSLTVNGTAIDLQDGVYTYNFELPYGTVDAPTVVAVANAAPYATVSAITVDGTTKATFTVTAESSATQDYVVNFSIARFPTIYLWDGSTMSALSDITAAATAAGVAVTTTGVSVTSFSAKTCEENGKSYTKALDFGGKTQASRNFGIEIPAGKVAKVSLVYRAKSTSRSIMIATALSDAVDESTITSKDAVDASNLYIMTADMFGGGTLYINTTDGFHVHEISIQLTEGYGRSAMLGNGVLGTVCVPNNVAVEDIQGATFYELAGREPEHGKLAFDEITSGELEAGVPYLFQAQGNHIALLYGATSVGAPVDKGNGMYGTFTDITLTELTDVYYFAQKALWGCSDLTSLSVPANRAYVKLSEIDYLSALAPAPGRRRILMGVNGENQATGFENIESGDAPMKVMIDGTLYILRGEKVFDATGRLVK